MDGLHCAGCVASVDRALTAVEGVQEASVSLAEGSARLKIDPEAIEVAALTWAVVRAGYEVPVLTQEVAIRCMTCAACVRQVEIALGSVPGITSAEAEGIEETLKRRDEEREQEARSLLRRFWVGAALGLPVVIIGYAHFIPGFRSIDPVTMRWLWALSGVLTIPIMVYVGGRFFTGGWDFRIPSATKTT